MRIRASGGGRPATITDRADTREVAWVEPGCAPAIPGTPATRCDPRRQHNAYTCRAVRGEQTRATASSAIPLTRSRWFLAAPRRSPRPPAATGSAGRAGAASATEKVVAGMRNLRSCREHRIDAGHGGWTNNARCRTPVTAADALHSGRSARHHLLKHVRQPGTPLPAPHPFIGERWCPMNLRSDVFVRLRGRRAAGEPAVAGGCSAIT